MEVFDDEFYLEPSPDNEKRSVKRSSKNRTGAMLGCHC